VQFNTYVNHCFLSSLLSWARAAKAGLREMGALRARGRRVLSRRVGVCVGVLGWALGFRGRGDGVYAELHCV